METEKSERGDWVLLISVLQWTAINGDQICPSNWGGESGVGFFFLGHFSMALSLFANESHKD